MDLNFYLNKAVDEGFKGMRADKGGPFGAVIVRNGEIVGSGCNMVTSSNDPTAHGEVMAIRDACMRLQTFKLDGCILFSSAEPCPMCLAAAYWAGIGTVYYGVDRLDTEKIGFSDKFIYDEFRLPPEERKLKALQLDSPEARNLFAEWAAKADKIPY